jgi:16S rRNA (guanine527-N7)-methyltransferase
MGEVDPRALRERLAAGLAAMGMSVGDADSAGLIAYLALPVKWSRAYNLTAVRDPLEMVPRHLLHSLSVAPYLFGDSVLDLGTGAGLPGIPLALLNPKRRFWLLDGNCKKTRFVRQAVMESGLTNCEVVHARMESYRPGRKFVTIVARAVASVSELKALGEPLLERPGRPLLMKGRMPEDEMEGIGSPTARAAGPGREVALPGGAWQAPRGSRRGRTAMRSPSEGPPEGAERAWGAVCRGLGAGRGASPGAPATEGGYHCTSWSRVLG